MNFYHLLRQTVYFHFIWIQCDRHLHLVRLQIATNIVKRNFKLIIRLQTHSSWFMMVLQFTDWKSKKKRLFVELPCDCDLLNDIISIRIHTTTKTQCYFFLLRFVSFQFAIFVQFCLKVLIIIILAEVTINKFLNGRHEFHCKYFFSFFNFILCLGNCCILENSFDPWD